MTMHSLPRRVFLLALLPFCTGCVAFYTREPVRVQVIDAETEEPIERAVVTVNYGPAGVMDLNYALTVNKPEGATAVTDENGEATVRAANFAGVFWSIDAPGYLADPMTSMLSHEIVPADIDGGEDSAGQRHALVRLYNGPEPSVSVVVPDGYRGLLLIESIETDSFVQGAPGEREFEFHANDRGYMAMEQSRLLQWHAASSLGWNFRYANGQPIPDGKEGDADDAIALRHVAYGTTHDVFVIGTPLEKEAMFRLTHIYKDEDTSVGTRMEKIEELFTAARGDDETRR